ncbi:MAG: hypothetical protein ACRDBM_02015, partial [Sporomusa sp.]
FDKVMSVLAEVIEPIKEMLDKLSRSMEKCSPKQKYKFCKYISKCTDGITPARKRAYRCRNQL